MTVSIDSPYPGLRPFRREEAALFFGRDACVEDMLNRLAATRFLAVLGPSGSGKSSLVRTGLFEALYTGAMPGAGSRWLIADLRPAGRPMENLARALLRAGAAEHPERPPPGPEDIAGLRAFLLRGERAIEFWCGEGNLPVGSNLLILADQFEELFSHAGYAARDEAEGFVRRLVRASRAEDARVYVVLTMRSDYLGHCALFPDLAERINEGTYLTRRMTSEEMREAITGPAFVRGFTIEPQLVDRIVNDLAGFAAEEATGPNPLESLARRADQLPLMQHALNQIWRDAEALAAAPEDVVLKAATYERLGGLTGALNSHGKRVLDSLGPDARVAETVFRALVEGDSLATALRRPCRLQTLVELAGGNRDGVLAVVTAFAAEGCDFLQTDPAGPLTDDTTVEIRHESLIRQWEQLGLWTRREAEDRAAYADLLMNAEKWRHARASMRRELERDVAGIWEKRPDPPAAWARRAGGDHPNALAFLAKSRRRGLRSRRRYQLAAAAALVLAVLTGVLLSRLDVAPVLIIPTIEGHLGSAAAAARLGDAYHDGRIVKQNFTAAFHWYHVAAVEGDFHSEVRTAQAYRDGQGTAQSPRDAWYWFDQAVQQDGTADNQDSQDALYALALDYQYGDGTAQDNAQAFRYYMIDAKAGRGDAQLMVGYFYDNGLSVPQDYKQAMNYYLQAANQPSPDLNAFYDIALLYQYGNGVPQSDANAILWYGKAAAAGDAESALEIGFIYVQQKNFAQAVKACNQAVSLARAAIAKDPADSADATIGAKALHAVGIMHDDGDFETGAAAVSAAVDIYTTALGMAGTALQIAPQDPDATRQKILLLGDRAWSELKLGLFQPALTDSTQAIALATQTASASASGGAGAAASGVPPAYIFILGDQSAAQMMLGDFTHAATTMTDKRYLPLADTGNGNSWKAEIAGVLGVMTLGIPSSNLPAPILKLPEGQQTKILQFTATIRAALQPPPPPPPTPAPHS